MANIFKVKPSKDNVAWQGTAYANTGNTRENTNDFITAHVINTKTLNVSGTEMIPGAYLELSGGTMTGDINMKSSGINFQNNTPTTLGTIAAVGTALRISGQNGASPSINADDAAFIGLNDLKNNVDTFISGDNISNLVYVDASTDRVGIGKNNPSTILDISGTLTTTNLAGTTLTGSLLLNTNNGAGAAGNLTANTDVGGTAGSMDFSTGTQLSTGTVGNGGVINAYGGNSQGSGTAGNAGVYEINGGDSGTTTGNGGDGGSISMRGGLGGTSGNGGKSGIINMGGSNAVTTTNGADGGSINTSASGNRSGGTMNLAAGSGDKGGSIIMNNGAGSINTASGRFIQLGLSGTRLTISGLASTPTSIGLSGLVAAPSTTLTPAFTSYYGGNTNALGDPNFWMDIIISGVKGRIPIFT